MNLLKHIKFLGLIILFIGCTNVAFSQNQDSEKTTYKKFDKQDYEKAIEGVDYTENIAKRKKKEPKEWKERKPLFDGFNFGNFGVLAELFKILGIVCIALLLAYLIYRLVLQNYSNKKVVNIDDHEVYENLEQHIHELDLPDLLQQAIQQGNYKLAVRIYYLIIIKKMSNSNLIHWKKQKTNGEYLSEMYGKPLFENFRKSTNLFERVWYGDVEIDQNKYTVAKQVFDVLLNKIPNNNNDEA